MVTRTIYQYDHMLVKFGGNSYEEKHVVVGKKLGQRKMAEYIKENKLDGYVLVKVTNVPVRYGMPVDVFMANASIIDDEEE